MGERGAGTAWREGERGAGTGLTVEGSGEGAIGLASELVGDSEGVPRGLTRLGLGEGRGTGDGVFGLLSVRSAVISASFASALEENCCSDVLAAPTEGLGLLLFV